MTDKPRIILEGKSLGEYFEQVIENKKLKDKLYTELIENNKQLTEIMMKKIYEKETKNAY